MTASELAEIVAKAQAEGAPKWGVTLIVQTHELRQAFDRHCEAELARQAPLKAVGQRAFEMIVIAVLLWLLMQAPTILGGGP